MKGVVSDDIRRLYEKLPDRSLEPLVQNFEFISELFLQREITGVARSLSGRDFLVSTKAHHHLYSDPHPGQTWHPDGLSETAIGITHLQCYYYPQEFAIEDGPTMILPGSVVVGHYGVWHKAGPKLNSRKRGMIKFSYFRTAPPEREWVTASDEILEYKDQSRLPYVTEVEGYRERIRRRRSWEWLCGQPTDRDQTEWGTDGVLASGAKTIAEIKL